MVTEVVRNKFVLDTQLVNMNTTRPQNATTCKYEKKNTNKRNGRHFAFIMVIPCLR
jgi:hypothetical protein